MSKRVDGGMPTKQPGDAHSTDSISKRSRRRARRRKRTMAVVLVLTAALLIATASVAWLAFRAQQIQSSLTASMALLPQLQGEITTGNSASAGRTMALLQGHTAAAREAGYDPVWRLAGMLPMLGVNFSAVTDVSVSADDVVNGALAPMLDHFDSLEWSSLTPVDGRVNVAPLREVAPTLSAAALTVQLSYERLAGIDSSKLVPRVSAPLTESTEALDQARRALNAASSTAQILPSMLGSDGPRNYLLLIQNSAEVRATGGIPGALAVITVSNGHIELSAQGSASSLGAFRPPISVDASQEAIYSERLGSFMQSVNLTPDFPTAAATAKAMWEDRHDGVTIDGVVALDPIVLANILGATGPVELNIEDPTIAELVSQTELPEALTEENVVSTLLSDVYREIEEPRVQDEYFAAVAGEVFGTLASGEAEDGQLVRALIESSNQGRLYLWSSISDEQDVIAGTSLAGAATGPLAGGAAFGAYFNDGTAGKMDYYVRRTVQLRQNCTEAGYLRYTLASTLTNTATPDVAVSLPPYVTGTGTGRLSPGSVRTNVVSYGPDRSRLQTARINGEPAALGSYLHGNRPVGVLTATLSPGQTATVEVDFTDVVQTSEPKVDVTPTIQPLSEVLLPMQADQECSRGRTAD